MLRLDRGHAAAAPVSAVAPTPGATARRATPRGALPAAAAPGPSPRFFEEGGPTPGTAAPAHPTVARDIKGEGSSTKTGSRNG